MIEATNYAGDKSYNVAEFKDLPHKNLLINGDFTINQRGKNDYRHSTTSEGAYQYTLDMWKILKTQKTGVKPISTGVRVYNESNGNTYFVQNLVEKTSTEKTVTIDVANVSGKVDIYFDREDNAVPLKKGLNTFKTKGNMVVIKLYPTLKIPFKTTVDINYIDMAKGSNFYVHHPEEHQEALRRCQQYVYLLPKYISGGTFGDKHFFYVSCDYSIMANRPKKIVAIDNPQIKFLDRTASNVYADFSAEGAPAIVSDYETFDSHKTNYGIFTKGAVVITCEP